VASRFSVEAVFKAVDRITAPVTRMQNRIGKMTRSMRRGLRSANRALDKVIGGFRRGVGTVAKFGGAIFAAVGIAAVAAINKVADAADNLAKRARRLEFPIEELQEWQFVAEQSGIASDQFDKSIEKFTKSVGEAKAGTGQLVTILKKANPALLEQIQGANGASEAFDIYLKALRETKDQTVKTALATAAFGRTGAKFLNITEQSTKAIKALRLEQRQNGVMTAKQAANAEAYNDAVNSLKRSLGGLLQNIILPMLPKLTETVRVWREWIVTNKDMIRLRVMAFLTGVKETLRKLIDIFSTFNAKYNLPELFKKGVEAAIQFTRFLAGNGAMILKIIAGVLALSIALKTLSVVMAAIGLIAKANPIGILVTLLVGLAALIIKNWIPIKTFFIDLWAGIVTIFDNSITAILDVVDQIIAGVSTVTGAVSAVAGLFGFGDDDKGDINFNKEKNNNQQTQAENSPQIISPQARIAKSINETTTTNKSEVTIKDETGRAKVTSGKLGGGLSLQATGAF